MTSANSLMSRSRRGLSRVSRPPAAGMKVTSERTIGLRLAVFIGYPSSNSHPNHVGDHNGAASGHPPCIRSQVTRLHVASFVRQVARRIGGIVHGRIDHSLVHPVPQDFSGAVDQRFDKEDGVKLIDIVLIDNRTVESAQTLCEERRQLRAAAIKQIRQQPSEPSDADGNTHQYIFNGLRGLWSGSLYGYVRYLLEHGSQEMFEAISVSDESPNNR